MKKIGASVEKILSMDSHCPYMAEIFELFTGQTDVFINVSTFHVIVCSPMYTHSS